MKPFSLRAAMTAVMLFSVYLTAANTGPPVDRPEPTPRPSIERVVGQPGSEAGSDGAAAESWLNACGCLSLCSETDEAGVCLNTSCLDACLEECRSLQQSAGASILGMFLAVDLGDQVELYWTTSFEHENIEFEVERSANGRRFEAIGWIRGTGGKAAISEYRFIDPNPFELKNHYRLRIRIGEEEKTLISEVVSTHAEKRGRFEALFSAQADGRRAELTVFADKRDRLTVEILDTRGEIAMVRYLDADPGRNQFVIDLADLSEGVYILRLMGLGAQRSFRIVRRELDEPRGPVIPAAPETLGSLR